MPESHPLTPIRFTLNQELVVKAAILNSSRYYVRFLCFVAFVGLATSIFFMFRRSTWHLERELLSAFLIVVGTIVVGFMMIALMRYVVYPLHARKNFQQQKALLDEMELSWAADTFFLTTGKSRSEMPFANLHGYGASREIIILYLSDAIYYMVPIAAFESVEMSDQFKRKLEESGVKRL